MDAKLIQARAEQVRAEIEAIIAKYDIGAHIIKVSDLNSDREAQRRVQEARQTWVVPCLRF